MAYEMRGQFLEACDCSVSCPCWFEEDPDEDECSGIVAWYIEQGSIDEVDVSGLTVVSVSYHEGTRGTLGDHPKMRIALFVDEAATAEQEDAIGQAFSGELGGPLGELAEMHDEAPGVERAAIAFSHDGATTRVTVADAVDADMTPLVGATDRVITVGDSTLASLLGTPGEVCKSGCLTLDLPQQSVSVEVEGRSAMRGRFSYLSY